MTPGWCEAVRLTPARVVEVVAADPGWFGLVSSPSRAELIGYGESYDAWRVRDASGGDVVVRVARRPVHELPKPLDQEAAAYRLIPPGVGPRLLAVDPAGERFGGPCLVISYLPGVPGGDPSLWDARCLDHLAGQLARLHATTSYGWGPVTLPEAQRSRRLSAVTLHADAQAWWAANHGYLLERPEAAALLKPAAAYVAAREPAFAALVSFVFTHGDLIATNILVDDGIPRFVDWEWAEFSDPARDLAYLGGAVPVPPFTVPLSVADRATLVASYLARSGTTAYGGTAALAARIEVWELHERFFTWLHHQRVADAGRDVHGRYARAVAAGHEGLQRVLLA